MLSFKRCSGVRWLELVAGREDVWDKDCQRVRMGKTFEKPHLLFTGTTTISYMSPLSNFYKYFHCMIKILGLNNKLQYS